MRALPQIILTGERELPMPLLDQFGHEIPLAPSRPRVTKPRPKTAKHHARRVSSKSIQAVRQVQMVEVTLVARHHINGQPYGPGRVVVERALAQVLRENDQRAEATDKNLTGSRACVIGPGASKGGFSVKQVAPEYFDTLPITGVPFGVVDRASGAFTPY